MSKRKLVGIVLLFTTVITAGFIYYFIFQHRKIARTFARELNYQILTKSLAKYQQVWNEAPPNFACGYLKKLIDVDTNYLKNNPDFFECFLSKGRVLVRIDDEKYYVYAVKQDTGLHYKVVTRSTSKSSHTPIYGIEVEIKVAGRPNDSMIVTFEDTFHEVYLPQRKYGIGPFVSKGDFTWDNLNQNIFIDKYLVTYRDIAEWKFQSSDPHAKTASIDLPHDKTEWVKPATGLTQVQMKQFCHFRGKELLQSHIYDAATFHPVDLSEPLPLKVVRGPFPWTFRRKNTLKSMPSFDFKLCSKFFVSECRGNAPYEFYDTRSSSWIGIYQILGGYMESVNNIFNPRSNLIPSSFYFDYKSPWHQLGVRGGWDGTDFGLTSFNWELNGKEELPLGDFPNFKVGFRCMRYVNEN